METSEESRAKLIERIATLERRSAELEALLLEARRWTGYPASKHPHGNELSDRIDAALAPPATQGATK